MAGPSKLDDVLAVFRNVVGKAFDIDFDDPHVDAACKIFVNDVLTVESHHAVEFSKLTEEDVVNLGVEFNPTEDTWQPDRVSFTVTERLKFYMKFLPLITRIGNEASLRVLINLFLVEASLKDVSMEDVEKARSSKYALAYEIHAANIIKEKFLKVGGRFDYVFGSRGSLGEFRKLYLIILEAKRGLDRKAECQLLGELVDVMLANEGTERTVSDGVLTTGYVWQFLRMSLKEMSTPEQPVSSDEPQQASPPTQPASQRYEWCRSVIYDCRQEGHTEVILGILRYMLESG